MKAFAKCGLALVSMIGASITGAAAQVGFVATEMTHEEDAAIPVAIWYPTDALAEPQTVGPFTMEVTFGAEVSGNALPLVVISHGTGGSKEGHHDTATALAQAGFVVAAIEHAGDNYGDQSRVNNVAGRTRQLQGLISFMLEEASFHEIIDADRVGAFGFSAGGYTVLAAAGGVPDLSLKDDHCTDHPDFFDCNLPGGPPGPQSFEADTRIKAVVTAAPALGFAFVNGLDDLTIPIQLWRAEYDQILPAPYYAEAVRAALPRAPHNKALLAL